MEQKTPQRLISKKIVRPFIELVTDKIFILPKSLANSIDTVTGKPCIWVGINGQSYNIIVDEPTPIPYNVFCVLKDIGILNYYKSYNEGDSYEN